MVGGVAIVVARGPGLARGVVADDGQAQRQVAQLLRQTSFPDAVGGTRGASARFFLRQAACPAAATPSACAADGAGAEGGSRL